MNERSTYPLVVVSVGSALVVLFAGACTILAVGHGVPTELWAAASALSGALVGILVPAPGSHAAAAALTVAKHRAAATTAARERGNAESLVREANQALRGAKTAELAAAAAEAAANAADPAATHDAETTMLARAAKEDHTRTRAARQSLETEIAQAELKQKEASDRYDALVAAGTTLGDSGAAAAADTAAKFRLGLVFWMFAITLAGGIFVATQVGGTAPPTGHDAALKDLADTLIALASAAGGALVGALSPTPTQAGGSV